MQSVYLHLGVPKGNELYELVYVLEVGLYGMAGEGALESQILIEAPQLYVPIVYGHRSVAICVGIHAHIGCEIVHPESMQPLRMPWTQLCHRVDTALADGVEHAYSCNKAFFCGMIKCGGSRSEGCESKSYAHNQEGGLQGAFGEECTRSRWLYAWYRLPLQSAASEGYATNSYCTVKIGGDQLLRNNPKIRLRNLQQKEFGQSYASMVLYTYSMQCKLHTGLNHCDHRLVQYTSFQQTLSFIFDGIQKSNAARIDHKKTTIYMVYDRC